MVLPTNFSGCFYDTGIANIDVNYEWLHASDCLHESWSAALSAKKCKFGLANLAGKVSIVAVLLAHCSAKNCRFCLEIITIVHKARMIGHDLICTLVWLVCKKPCRFGLATLQPHPSIRPTSSLIALYNWFGCSRVQANCNIPEFPFWPFWFTFINCNWLSSTFVNFQQRNIARIAKLPYSK